MEKKSVVVFGGDSVFTEAIGRMLAGDPSLEITPVFALDDAAVFEILEREHPDVLVLTSSPRKPDQGILLKVLQNFAGIVVTIDIDCNLMHVHPGRKLIQKPADLFSIIHSG